MNENSKLWFEAAKMLAVNPDTKVPCPECKKGTLDVKDEPFGENKLDRYMVCGSCGKWNVLILKKPN